MCTSIFSDVYGQIIAGSNYLLEFNRMAMIKPDVRAFTALVYQLDSIISSLPLLFARTILLTLKPKMNQWQCIQMFSHSNRVNVKRG